ncbi:Na(+)-translocating NADH-quinone reductase subunit C [Aureibacter tunicatorum]|nr:Na(+)-translocating NADH-quinone reductase subunit C [Aureibacter tunicatorum]
MTVVVGGLLSLAAVALKPMQKIQVELDTKKSILKSVMTLSGTENVTEIYNNRIVSLVVDAQGNEVSETKGGDPVIAENVNIKKEFKKKADERIFPVFKFVADGDPNKVEAYILPIYGNGLWNNIWGYIAINPDWNTIEGIVFDHAGETPGLGARITEEEVQERYKNRLLFDQNGKLISVQMVKGEGHPEAELGSHKVDGMSGATLTANGVNDMLYNYMSYYLPYIKKNKK